MLLQALDHCLAPRVGCSFRLNYHEKAGEMVLVVCPVLGNHNLPLQRVTENIIRRSLCENGDEMTDSVPKGYTGDGPNRNPARDVPHIHELNGKSTSAKCSCKEPILRSACGGKTLLCQLFF